MSHLATPARTSAGRPAYDFVTSLPARVTAAALAVCVSLIHVKDQGGLTALKDPAYLGQGFRLLELTGVLVATVLLLRPRITAWLVAAGVALGPIVGLTLSRSVGLPMATDDIGNWGETLGVEALATEGCLLALCAVVLLTWHRRRA